MGSRNIDIAEASGCCRLTMRPVTMAIAVAAITLFAAFSQARAQGNDCITPFLVTLPTDLTPNFVHVDTTCGRLNDYSTTCMGNYDGGEDFVYQIDVQSTVCVNLSVNGDVWLGIGIDTACPLSASNCLAIATTSSATDTISNLLLTPGTYFVMLDTWPAPNCSAFTFTIDACPTGGCCTGGGVCQILSQSECNSLSGFYRGNSTDCGLDGMACSVGACCLPGGSCTDTGNEGDCDAAGGFYFGDGTACGSVTCPAFGGCCVGGGVCEIHPQSVCNSLSGFYRGDNSDCGVDNMACVQGACCDSMGGCTIQTGTDCDTAGGFYFGDGTACESVTCPAYGACCTGNACTEEFAPDCAAGGGLFIGNGIPCSSSTCSGIIPLNYNWNGMVHSGESGNPDSLPGYRSIADRGLTAGNTNSLGGTNFRVISGDLTYYLGQTRDVVDIIHIGNANVFDTVDDTDTFGIAPSWDPSGGTGFVASSTTNLSKSLDANFKMGVLYHGTRNGGTFNMTLNLMNAGAVQVTLGAPDWFANNNPAIPAPQVGVASLAYLPGPLSAGDGFEGTFNDDSGVLNNPLNVVQAIVTRDSLFNAFGVDVTGDTLTSIVFDNWAGSSATSGNGIFAASIALTGACCDSGTNCTESLRSACEALGNVFLGDGTTCMDDGAACLVGACCLEDGSCDSRSATACANAGGLYQGNGTNCASVTCPPVGACCIDNGDFVDCLVTFESTCNQVFAGAYLGNGAECALQPNGGSVCDCNGNGIFDDLDLLPTNASPTVYNSTNTPLAIPDNNANGGAFSPIIATTSGTVSDVNVTVNITHLNDAHLDIYLLYEDGSGCKRIELSTDNGGSGDHYSGTVFDDSAATAVTAGAAPFAGSFRPENPLSMFNGLEAAATWTLIVADDTSATTGTLDSWSIEITAGDAPVSSDCNGNGILDECELVDPSTVGACCLLNATCETTTSASCDAAGGLYLGDCTNCDVATCPALGACCTTEGCMVTSRANCVTAGGYYAGNGIDCLDYDCTRGACCTPGVGCDDSGDASSCDGPTDVYYGDGTRCTSITCGTAQSLPLNYNWNGMVHSGESGMPDAPNGYRSIGDRGITFGNANSLGGATGTVTLGNLTYQLEPLAAPALDIIHVGYRKDPWDILCGLNATVGIAPDWDPSQLGDGKFVPSNTSTFTPTEPLDSTFELGILYNASEGGGDFDMTLGFTDATSVTVRFDSKDWFANNNPNPDVPGATSGIASMTKLAGPLSAGDGFEGTTNTDAALIENPLSVFQGRVTHASLLAMAASFDVTGKQLSSITFGNWSPNSVGNMAAGVAIYASSVVAPAPAGCDCAGDLSGDDQIDGDDIQGFVDCLLGGPGDCSCADVDGINGVDIGDVDDFVTNLLTVGPNCP